MSSRATRPRSRRGRQAPPGELDPVAESSEEAEAAGGNAKPRAAAPRESGRWAAAGPHLAGRTAQEADGVASAPAADAPEGPADLSVFQSLQRALSSLEAAAAAWRRRPAEGAGAGGPGPSAEQEGAGGGAREAARLAEKNAWLRLALQSREDELGHTRAALRALEADKETLQREVQELQDTLMRLEPLSPRTHSHAGGSGSGSSSSGADGEPWGGQVNVRGATRGIQAGETRILALGGCMALGSRWPSGWLRAHVLPAGLPLPGSPAAPAHPE